MDVARVSGGSGAGAAETRCSGSWSSTGSRQEPSFGGAALRRRWTFHCCQYFWYLKITPKQSPSRSFFLFAFLELFPLVEFFGVGVVNAM